MRMLAYSASKATMIQMARSMACELGPKKIRVNSLSPGYMYTGSANFTHTDSKFIEIISFQDDVPIYRCTA